MRSDHGLAVIERGSIEDSKIIIVQETKKPSRTKDEHVW